MLSERTQLPNNYNHIFLIIQELFISYYFAPRQIPKRHGGRFGCFPCWTLPNNDKA
jgi:hypothetical protein